MGIFDDFTGKSANKARRQNENSRNQAVGLFNQLQGRTDSLFAQGQGYAQQLLPTIQAGFGRALTEIDRQGEAARTRATDSRGQMIGASTAALTNRGLSNTTLMGNAIQGAYSQTERQMQEIDGILAGLRSDVRLGQVGAEIGALNTLMSYYQRQTALQQGTTGQGIDAWYGAQFTAPSQSQAISGLLQGAGAVAGAF